MANQYGRIGHWAFLQIYTSTRTAEFHRATLAPTPSARGSRYGSTRNLSVTVPWVPELHIFRCWRYTSTEPHSAGHFTIRLPGGCVCVASLPQFIRDMLAAL